MASFGPRTVKRGVVRGVSGCAPLAGSDAPYAIVGAYPGSDTGPGGADGWREFRFVVTGGRAFRDYDRVADACDTAVAGAYRALCYPGAWRVLLGHGAAVGADLAADAWCEARRHGAAHVLDQRRFPVTSADYDAAPQHERWRAPYGRNTYMLEQMRPHLVVALPGGGGTQHAVREARRLGFPVWRPYGAERAVTPASRGRADRAAAILAGVSKLPVAAAQPKSCGTCDFFLSEGPAVGKCFSAEAKVKVITYAWFGAEIENGEEPAYGKARAPGDGAGCKWFQRR